MDQSQLQSFLSDFAHQLRQPLSTIRTLASYLEMIVPAEDVQVLEQLRRMHVEVDLADQVLRQGLCDIIECVSSQDGTDFTVSPEGVVEELSRPLANAAMASVT